MEKSKTKLTKKELELLIMLAGSALLDKEVLKSFDFSFEEKLSLNNKLRYLLIQSKNGNQKPEN